MPSMTSAFMFSFSRGAGWAWKIWLAKEIGFEMGEFAKLGGVEAMDEA